MQTLTLINRRIEKILSKLEKKNFNASTNQAFSHADKTFLQDLVGEVHKIVHDIRCIKPKGNRYDQYVIRYLRYVMILSFMIRVYQLLGSAHPYCMQYMREFDPKKIHLLDQLLSSQGVWSVRIIPVEFLTLLLPQLSPKVRDMAEKVIQAGMDKKGLFRFDTQSLGNLIDTRILPHKISLIKRIGLFMSHVKLRRPGVGLITAELSKEFQKSLKPGDILLTRGNWNLTNASIPGFWKHMSIYIGAGKVCEAVGEGIRTIALTEMLSKNDYCLAIRTHFSSQKVQQAIAYVEEKVGQQYDFSFNYFCEKSMVCSALVTKSYLPKSDHTEGLKLQLEFKAGAYSYPPNALAKKMATELGTSDEQLFPVAFIDASEKREQAFLAAPETSLTTWKRSRWSVWQS